jgi:serine/threonine protein kinase, bacterial
VTDLDNRRVLKLPAGSNNQVVLPFVGLQAPNDVAVDGAGNVYVADGLPAHSRVLKLSTRSNSQVELPFAGLNDVDKIAVDGTGNVYVADSGNSWVLKLPAGIMLSPPRCRSLPATDLERL